MIVNPPAPHTIRETGPRPLFLRVNVDMRTEDKEILRNLVAFLIGFIGFAVLWNLVILPAIVK